MFLLHLQILLTSLFRYDNNLNVFKSKIKVQPYIQNNYLY